MAAWLLICASAGAQEQASEAAEADPVLRPPELLKLVDAEVPPDTAREVDQRVALSIEVLPDGSVGEILVLEGAGEPFDGAALAAGRQMLFKPATYGDSAVAVKIRFTYRFERRVEPAPEVGATPEEPAPPPPLDLTGEVLERGSRRPLVGAVLQIAQGEQVVEVVSDGQGGFEAAVGAGEQRVVVVHPGHIKAELTVEVVEGERTNLVVYLQEKSKSPYSTVVRSRKPRREVTRTTLQAREVTKIAGTFGEPFRVIEALPGLLRVPLTGGFLVVRGANPRDTGVFLDGHEIPLLYHFAVGSAVFNADLVRSIEFSPGNWTVRHGRRLGGLVEVRTKEERPERMQGHADIDLIDVGVLVNAPIGESQSGFGAVRRSHLDGVAGLGEWAGVVPEGAAAVIPRYWDYQVGGGFDLPGLWRGRALAYGSDDGFETSADEEGQGDGGPSSDATTLGIAFHRMLGRAWRPLGEEGRLDVSTSLGVDLLELSFGENSFDTAGWNFEGRADARWALHPRLDIEVGTDIVLRRYVVDLSFPQPRTPWEFPTPTFDDQGARFNQSTDLDQIMPAAYLGLDWRPLDWLQIIPGLRVDLFAGEALNALTFDPRLVTRVRVAEPVWLKGGVGLFHQPPEAFQVASELGNPDLEVPQALHISAGAEIQLAEAIDLDLTGFSIRRSKLVTISRRVEVEEGAVTQETFDNDREERAIGLEILLRHRPSGPFFGWLAYTLSQTERRETADAAWQPHPLDQPHVLTAVGSWDFGNGWEAGGRARLVSGNPITPVVGAVWDDDRNSYRPIRGEARSDRLPAFFQIDLRVDRKWTFDTWFLNLYVDVINVTWRDNGEFVQYNYDFSERKVIPGLPILPSFGLKGEF